MKIVADSKIPYVLDAFAGLADVVVVEAQSISPAIVRDADVLVVRSETKVNRWLVGDTALKFVATATIGTDHVDTGYLQERGIGFASAPGSNARSVAEYVVAALLVIAARRGLALAGGSIGVVGVGNVGKIVVRFARALGMEVLQNDPPLARATDDPVFLPLDRLMEADIITLHVPLTKTGDDKTFHLFDESRIRRMRQGSILINTSRGGVVETEGIKGRVHGRHLAGCVLDVWEGEPAIDTELVGLALLGTPHIAGYSFDGKVNGTVMVQKAVCEHFGLHSTWAPPDLDARGGQSPVLVPEGVQRDAALLAAIRTCYDIEADDRALRQISNLPLSERPIHFRRLRREYRMRREFPNYRVMVPGSQMSLLDVFRTLGFVTMSAGD